MRESASRKLVLPMSGIVAVALVALGVGFWMFVSRGLLIIAGLGAFGPGVLRELGWLSDHDEFQREAAHRAGYHAYLAGGMAALIVLSVIEWGGGSAGDSAEWIRVVVVVLWLTWLSSTLLSYWGARKTTARVLTAFGSFWAVFVVATLIGDAGAVLNGAALLPLLLGVLVGIGVIAPFFGLAWTAGRWPRVTGVALLIASLVLVYVFRNRSGFQWSTTALTFTLLIGPLVTCGLALVFDWGSEGQEKAAV